MFALLFSVLAFAFPGAPVEETHPGSKVYRFEVEQKKIRCQKRDVDVFLPKGKSNPSVVVYGHGQALDASHYKGTLEHLAKKGIAAIHPTYDTGFFDQDWNRMAVDYVNLAKCAVDQFSLDSSRVVFAGHSKGAYVASIAAGLAYGKNMGLQPKSVVLYAPAGADQPSLPMIAKEVSLTVVHSDKDTVVSKDLSNTIFKKAGSEKKQFIRLKSYTDFSADHFWPLTKGSFVGGGPEGPLHYYGAWKWLVAAVWELETGDTEYLYGKSSLDKGVDGLMDEAERSWASQ
jgi:acetyl esterase/lipase